VGVPDDPARPEDRSQAVVRVEEGEAEEDLLTMPSGDTILAGDGWDSDAIVASPLGEFGDPLAGNSGDGSRTTADGHEDTVVVVTISMSAGQPGEGFTQRQDATAAAVNWVDRLAGQGSDSIDRQDDLRRNDALFIALAGAPY
jgi:hypothetical protein